MNIFIFLIKNNSKNHFLDSQSIKKTLSSFGKENTEKIRLSGNGNVLTEAHFTRQGTQMHCFADYETISCFWTGTYDPAKRRCTYDISCFIQEEDGRYTRTDDRVVERVWLPEELGKMLENAGFAKVRVLSGQDVPVGRTGQNRLYYICEKD